MEAASQPANQNESANPASPPPATAAANNLPTTATHFGRTIETYGGIDLRTLAAVTQPLFPSNKYDLVTVEPHLIIMSLRSGLLLSQSWALNVLTILANEPLIDFPLSHLHQLFGVLFDLLAFSLSLVPTVPSSLPGPNNSFASFSASLPTSPLARNPFPDQPRGHSEQPPPQPHPAMVHDLLAFEYERFGSILHAEHRLHSPATVLDHSERALCIENIFRGFSFSEHHADAMLAFPQFLPTLLTLLTNYPLEHRKNALVILSNVAGKLMFSRVGDLEVVLAVLTDCILNQVDADRTYTYFPFPVSNNLARLLAQFPGNPAAAHQAHQQAINGYTYFNWDPFYFSSNALEILVQLSLLIDNRGVLARASLPIISELVRKLSLVITEELEDLDDVDVAEMGLVVLSNLSDLTDTLRLLIASQTGLIRSLVRFARFPVLITVRDEATRRQNTNIMRFAAQALLGISRSREVQLILRDYEPTLFEATCDPTPFTPLLAEVLYNTTKATPMAE